MIPAAFDYVRPTTLDEAIRSLADGTGETKVLAGGQSLLPLLKLRLARAGRLVDIGRIPELRGVRPAPDGGFGVGSLTTYAELMASPAASIGALADALPSIGDLQVRNVGTIGGAIAHADPASDLPAVLLALDATVVARGPNGERTIAIGQFFEGPFETALGADEILTEVRIPPLTDGAGSAYVSLEQRASGYALVGVAAVVSRDRREARIGVTGVAHAAYRAGEVEAALAEGATPADAAARAADGVDVLSDIHCDRDYRTAMAAVYARRAIEAAMARAI
ncbi:MAG TPA: xanthine dehydrogenase family protein subunit M [Candidatus Limnocylindrales bacterium]|nr:xanthine dehydrogenase family protein subunit M [Candidatus Limnocylindrales bacterium]